MAAPLGTVSRLSARCTSGLLRNNAASRAFQTSQSNHAAQDSTMPAMSPTMTEGNVTGWKIEEGDSLSTGNLLGIETDKAQMDFKAKDDGVVPKFIQGKGSKEPNKQTYPLYPSVQHLLHEIGLSTSEAEKIPASGPNGRLLKGDVLSYLGRIASSYSFDESTRISKLGHLDLSNIRVAKQTPKAGAPPTEAATPSLAPEPEIDTEVTVPISLRSVTQAQKRIQDSLGVFLPLSTFIARAADIANDDLPRLKRAKLSTDELFNQVVGLDKVLSTSRGSFMPQIIGLPRAPSPSLKQKQSPSADIIDILGGKAAPRMRSAKPVAGEMADASSANNIFSVSVPKGEEKRAKVFLDRVKNVLEAEPGRLVL